MATWTCGGCGAETFVGASRCPQCGSEKLEETRMGKISRVYGPTDANAEGYFEEGLSPQSPEVTETDVHVEDDDAKVVSSDLGVVGGQLPGPGAGPTVLSEEATPWVGTSSPTSTASDAVSETTSESDRPSPAPDAGSPSSADAEASSDAPSTGTGTTGKTTTTAKKK